MEFPLKNVFCSCKQKYPEENWPTLCFIIRKDIVLSQICVWLNCKAGPLREQCSWAGEKKNIGVFPEKYEEHEKDWGFFISELFFLRSKARTDTSM